jgi:CelD/BcsL family acetyltransferase involved in cellulose biosynthesis
MIERIEDEAGFAALRGEWDDLLRRSTTETPFLTWEWLYTWWRCLGRGLKPHLLAVRSEGRLVALAPMALRGWEPRRLRLFGSACLLGSPLTSANPGSDDLDFIVDSAHPEALDELADAVAAEGRVLELMQVPSTGSAIDRTRARLQAADWRAEKQETAVCPWVSLAGHTWETYLGSLGREHRYGVNRKLRKLEKEFAVRFEPARSEADRARALRWLIELHDRRWREKGESDAFHTPGLRTFHDEFTRLALERGWLRLYLLELSGTPVAGFYGLRYGSAFFFYQSGFDPAFGRYGVGVATMALSIQAALGEGASVYDMLHGEEEYKFHWANERRSLARHVLFPPRIQGALALALTSVYGLLRPMARRVLSQS